MKKRIWTIGLILGTFVCLGWSTGVVRAQGIPPVNAAGLPIPGSPVTVSIFQSGVEVTDTWLPVPGESVEIVVEGPVIGPLIELVPSVAADPIADGALATSAYPGDANNFGNSPAADFTFDGATNLLTALDHGGMAVIRVVADSEVFLFILPRDDDFDGIPTIFESLYCPSGNCARDADIDLGPDGLSPSRDGFANIDEYRGWRVSGQYVRGNPQVKDVFFHIEEDLQCTSGTMGDFNGGSGTDVNLAFFFGPNLTGLFDNVNTLSPGIIIHRIGSDEWVDNFDRYDVSLRVILTDSSEESEITDRWVNKNAIIPLGNADTDTGRFFVKGIRVIQCLDLVGLSPLGRADKNPPDLFLRDNGSAVLFIHRIVKSMVNKIKLGVDRTIRYYTFQGGSWTLMDTFPAAGSVTWDPSDPSIVDVNVQSIMKIALSWYFAHEAFEHALDVTDTVQGTRKVSYGYHHAEGAGTNVDLKFTHKVDKKSATRGGFNKFYIPKFHGISDKREIRVLSDQVVP